MKINELLTKKAKEVFPYATVFEKEGGNENRFVFEEVFGDFYEAGSSFEEATQFIEKYTLNYLKEKKKAGGSNG